MCRISTNEDEAVDSAQARAAAKGLMECSWLQEAAAPKNAHLTDQMKIRKVLRAMKNWPHEGIPLDVSRLPVQVSVPQLRFDTWTESPLP
jgi:hypothetical protein